MSSSIWSINSDRSSSSLSWEEENDESSENYLQNLFEIIDRIVFSDQQIPEDFPSDLSEECLIWKQKFVQKFDKVGSRNDEKKPMKLKSLSASKVCLRTDFSPKLIINRITEQTEQINVNYGSHIRSQSERRSSKTRFDSIPNKLNNRRDICLATDRLLTNQKPLILPPLVNVSHIRRNQSQTNIKSNVSKVPNITQMRTSFPKPAPVLSLEHLLKQSKSSLIEENGTKFPIVLHSNNYDKNQQKANDVNRRSALPFIHK